MLILEWSVAPAKVSARFKIKVTVWNNWKILAHGPFMQNMNYLSFVRLKLQKMFCN